MSSCRSCRLYGFHRRHEVGHTDQEYICICPERSIYASALKDLDHELVGIDHTDHTDHLPDVSFLRYNSTVDHPFVGKCNERFGIRTRNQTIIIFADILICSLQAYLIPGA